MCTSVKECGASFSLSKCQKATLYSASYNGSMIDALIKFYRDRWQAVESIERQEQRSSSVEQRWEQLNAIALLAKGLNLDLNPDPKGEFQIFERWAKIKEMHQIR